MKLRSLEELSNFLYEQITWRKKELLYIKSLVETNRNSISEKTFIRSGILILYAHWEGFVKSAAMAYLNFVGLQRKPYNELTSNFIAVAMKRKLSTAVTTSKATIYSEVADFFLNDLDKRSEIPWDSTISARDNLNSEVLQEILHIIGLDYSNFETKAKLIDETLLGSRNAIAHGEHYSRISYDTYIELHEQVLGLINEFHTSIENAAVLKLYLR